MTRTQFIVRIAACIAVAGGMRARAALSKAREAYQAFEETTGVTFGCPDHAWYADAARIIAHEFELAFWTE